MTRLLRVPFRRLPGAAALLLLTLVTGGAAAHPLHTTITDLGYDSSTGAVEMQIRVFAEDFDAATIELAPGAGERQRSVNYLARRIELRGSDDQLVVLRWAGAKKIDDVTLITLEGTARAGLRGGTLRQGMLLERFPDQVNILKTGYGGAARTLLFTRGSERKRLP